MAEGTDSLFVNWRTGKPQQVDTTGIEDGAVTTIKIATSAVTTIKIADDSVTFAKIQDISSDRLLGRDTAASGDVEEISVSTGLEFSGAQSIRIANTSVTAGSYTNTSLTVNAQGQLTAASSGAAGSTLSIIASSVSIGSVSAFQISLSGNTWDEVEVWIENLAPETDNVILHAQLSQSGTFLSASADYAWGIVRVASDGLTQAPVSDQDSADSEFQITGNLGVGNNTNETTSCIVRIFRPGASSARKFLAWQGQQWNITPSFRTFEGAGQLIANANAVDGVQFFFSSGSVASGRYLAVGKKYT